MEYMGDKEFWDKKFENRGNGILDPEKSLVENLCYLKEGTVLDIACGDGRNSIYLIEKGFKVTGVDFSEEALKRLEHFVEIRGLFVKTKAIDLSDSYGLKDIGVFDNIVVNHYRLNSSQLAYIKNHIATDGILFISGFGDKHVVDSRIRQDDLIQATDFQGLDDSFELIKFLDSKEDRGYFVTYIFKRK